ncbi:MAG: hypothetical protein MUF07_10875 [Steroidobacteraceae bacterium]|nr:hypothetical protein [Steroidobacteraceae bacterium]
MLALLERLKDDPGRYVQRSVANNLDDIGKDQPAALHATAKRWLRRAGVKIRRVVIEPRRPRIGGTVSIGFDLEKPGRRSQRVLADLGVHFVKAAGHASLKVFKRK